MIRLDGRLDRGMDDAAASARELETAGVLGAWAPETNHDPFLPLTVAAGVTDRLQLGTNVAVAFARTPMALATIAYDLHQYSGGRLQVGLGTQVRAHITRRFSMPWSEPVPRMREYVAALRAIWTAWRDESALDFRGDYYEHTLMTPFFSPGPSEHPIPRVFIAAVGHRLTELAGETADGLLCHSFTTPGYLVAVTIPALEAGIARSSRSRHDLEVSVPVFAITGDDDATRAAAREGVRGRLAFYGSTPAYRAVLEHHGWGDLAGELHQLSRERRWGDLDAAVGDEVVDAFAVVGTPTEIADQLVARYDGLVDRVNLLTPAGEIPGLLSGVAAALADRD